MNRADLRKAFLSNPEQTIGRIWFNNEGFTDADFAAVIRSLPALPQLQFLDLAGAHLGNEGLEALARAAEALGFPQLHSLSLNGTQVGNEGVEALASAAVARGFGQLRLLSFTKTQVGNQGVEALARAAEALGFPQLRSLSLNGTQVGNAGVEALARAAIQHGFPQLQSLLLSRTRVGDEGVEALARAAEVYGFPQLKSLTLKETQVGNKGVEELARAAGADGFPQLQTLVLDGTQVDDEGVEAIAHAAKSHGFPQLRKLALNLTQVGDKGLEALADAAEAGGFSQLQRLELRQTMVDVAVEELTTIDPRRIFRALKGSAIAEVKVVVIGEPEAGKSWFCKRFFLDKIPSERKETHDIELLSAAWKPHLWNLDVELKVWDFGGQHVLHGTHEMFFSRRSLAILVLDVTRSLQSNRVEYWQKLLGYCAGLKTPTIIVVSKCDKEFPIAKHKIDHVDPEELQYGLANVPQVIRSFSALTPVPTPGQQRPPAIEAVRSAIINAVGRIEDIHKKVSPESARMKLRVEREMKDRALVSLGDYHEWCREEDVDDRDQSILRTLHNFGSVFFFGHTVREKRLASDDVWLEELPPGEQRLFTVPRDYILNNWIVNSHWLKWPIYEVIRESADSQRMPSGIMTFEEIIECARKGALDNALDMPSPEGPTYVCKILELTGLCWELKQGVFLFPRGLTDGKPYGCDKWETRGWWEWGFLPEDSFHRFVVRMHERREVVKDGEDSWQHWRNAIAIEHPRGCRAVILVNPERDCLEARLDPMSQEPAGFAILCDFVGDLFENEIVKRPAATKQVPNSVAFDGHLIANSDEISTEDRVPESATHSPLEFASLINIYNGIKSVVAQPGTTSPPLPNYAYMSTWEVRDNGKTNQKRRFHIGEALDRFAKFYYKKKGATLTPEDRDRIEMKILMISKTNLG